MAQPAPAADPKLEERRQAQCAQKWIAELNASEKFQRRWLERAKKIVRQFKRQEELPENDPRKQFAILWSNTETMKPAIYSRPPEAVVGRRFKSEDPVARMASEVLERALGASIDLQDLDGRLREVRDDFVLIGRGQSWERYCPQYGPEETSQVKLQVVGGGEGDDQSPKAYADDAGNEYPDGDERVQFGEDGQPFMAGEPFRPVVYEESLTDYVNWEDFGHSEARTWPEVRFVWRRVYLSREELVERFGTVGKIVPLDWGPIRQGLKDISADVQNKAAVYEIWDKATRKAYWVSKSFSSRCLDERPDPLGLDGFFPCPKPVLATTANDSVIPTPDYAYYQGQANEIDKLTGRVAELQDALKVRGFYAAVQKTNLNQLFNAANNVLIPVPEWAGVRERGGARGMVEYWPIDIVVAALQALIEQRQQLINDVYQITGIGDVMRGMNDPRATATAERIKGAWGTLRVRDRQKEMIRFARDVLRIKGEVIAQKFDIPTLKAISGVEMPTAEEKAQAQATYQQGAQAYQVAVQQAQAAQQPPPPQPEVPPEIQSALDSPTWEDVVGLLRDKPGRQFRIDVETDSTVEPDEQEDRAAAIEFITALSTFIAQWGPQVQAQPALAPLASEALLYVVRRYRAGRELEATIERVMQQIMASPPKPEQAEAPDKTPVEVQTLKNQQEQLKQQSETQRAELEANVEMRGQDIDAQATHLKLVASARDPEPQASF
jgi:hypothetical protein